MVFTVNAPVRIIDDNVVYAGVTFWFMEGLVINRFLGLQEFFIKASGLKVTTEADCFSMIKTVPMMASSLLEVFFPSSSGGESIFLGFWFGYL
jgi:hypothetical protein